MATVLETQRRKALKGVIREIKHSMLDSYLICAEIQDENREIVSELPEMEVKQLNLQVGDTIDIFPLDIDTYLVVGKPKVYS